MKKVSQIRIRNLKIKANRELMLTRTQSINTFEKITSKATNLIDESIEKKLVQKLDEMRMNLKLAKRRTYRD